jgi:hypothetical protein
MSQERTERVIKKSVVAALLLRRELARHDLSERDRAAMLAAAMPALIILEDMQEQERQERQEEGT